MLIINCIILRLCNYRKFNLHDCSEFYSISTDLPYHNKYKMFQKIKVNRNTGLPIYFLVKLHPNTILNPNIILNFHLKPKIFMKFIWFLTFGF